MSTGAQGWDQPARAGDGERYRVDARGAEGLLVGDQGTQVNYFYRGTWTDGVAPAPLVSMAGAIDSPYRGLSAFGERDAALFFGREVAADQLLERMSRALEGTGLIVVSGVSGAGKSSLVRAGLLPRLRGAGLRAEPEASSWPCLVLTPGSRPLEELAVRVAPAAGADASAVLRELTADPGGFALTVRQAALARLGTAGPGRGWTGGAGQRRVLLVVDQAEQLFTQCGSEDERLAFIAALHAAATSGDRQLPAALVVLLVRADFEARLADYPLLAAAIQDRFLLTAMTERQLRLAITQPAIAAGSGVDAELVRVLLGEVHARSGVPVAAPGRAIGAGLLPLLSHALDQAWRSRAGQVVTLADYERAGGIEGAVASSAQRAYDRLSPAQQDAARQVFTRLVATSADGVDTADRATRADLVAALDDTQARDVEAVLEAFTAERLLTLAAGTVEISHEALLTAWPLLTDWLADTHADRLIWTRMRATAEEWNRAGRDPSYLYSGSLLDIAQEAAARIGADARQGPLGRAEEGFLRASLRAGRNRKRRWQGFTAILIVLVMGLAVATVTARRADQATVQQRDVAISGELASDSEAVGDTNASISGVESIAAYSIDRSAQARYVMLRAAASPEIATLGPGSGRVDSMALSRDDTILATGGLGGAVKLWSPTTRQQIRSLNTGFAAVYSVAFSPDGATLAVAGLGPSNGSAVELWNAATGHRIRSLKDISSRSVAFSPDGTILATGAGDVDGAAGNAIELWNAATGHLIRTLDFGPGNLVNSVAFGPDSAMLAVGGIDGRGGSAVDLWNAATGHLIRSLNFGSGNSVSSVTFSRDGTLATGDGSAVELWNTATGQQIHSLGTGAGNPVSSVAFSPDGTMLAVADNDGTILWNLATRQADNLAAGLGPVDSVAFTPGAGTLATGDGDGTVRLWDTGDSQIRGFPVGSAAGGDAAAFTPDGATLATSSDSGSAELWNVATGHPIRKLGSGSVAVYSMAFSPDGTMLATADDGVVELWNVATGHRILKIAVPTESVAFSPDGMTLATAGYRGLVELWNVATGHPIRKLGSGSHDDYISVAFSRDGTMLATGNEDNGLVEVWDAATGQQIHSLDTGAAFVPSVAFSRDGTTLATGDDGGTAELWDAATGQQIHSLDTGAGVVYSVAFSPDGKTLATGDSDGTAELWDAATGQQIHSLDTGAGELYSMEFGPNGTTLTAAYNSDSSERAADAVFVGGGPSINSTVATWNTTYLTHALEQLCEQAGGSLNPTEWKQYVPPGPPYQDICHPHS